MPSITGYTKAKTDEMLASRIRWGGVWNAETQYAAGDLVRKGDTGALWVATEDPLLGSIPESTSDPEKWRKSFDADTGGLTNSGGNSLTNTDGLLTASGDQLIGYAPYPANAKMTDQDYVQAKFGHAGGGEQGLSIEGTSWNLGIALGFNYGRASMQAAYGVGQPDNHYPGGGQGTEIAIVGDMPLEGWMRLQRDGNDLIFSYFSVDPITNPPPDKTFTWTLTSDLIATYGVGVELQAGVALKGAGWFDDLVVATPYSGPQPSWELVKA